MTTLQTNAILFLMLLLKFALRNLVRHWRRTSLTIMAMTFGLAINFWLDCMLRGRNDEVIKLVTESYTGNFQIYDKVFFEDKQISHQLDISEPDLQAAVSGKANIALRTHLPSLISSGENSLPIMLQGIRPDQESKVSTLEKSIKEGEFLSSQANCAPGEVVVGAKLARSLKVGVGEKVVLLTQATDGDLGNELFRIKGIYDTNSSNFDKVFVFTHEACAFQLGRVQAPHEVVIKVTKAEDQEGVFGSVKKLVKPEQILTTWDQSMPAVSRMVKVNNAIMGLVSFILLIVVILGFVNTLLMSVLERTREIGMMMAVGVTSWQVRILIVLEALTIAFISATLSIILGLLAVWYFQKTGFDLSKFVGENFDANQINLGVIIYPKISFWPFLKVIGFSLIIVVFSAFFPAYRASRLSPLDAIRSQ